MKDVLIALAGNQNCGKTTLFNRLTGSNQHVGNFPGVTVEKKMGQIKSFKEAALVDLPGIYSLSPYTSEEVVTRDFILKDDPDLIINIVDATLDYAKTSKNKLSFVRVFLADGAAEADGDCAEYDGRGDGEWKQH